MFIWDKNASSEFLKTRGLEYSKGMGAFMVLMDIWR